MADEAMGPEHQCNGLALEPLVFEAFSQVVGQLANGCTGFVGICCMLKTHARILAQRWSIRNNQACIFTTGNLIDPRTKTAQATTQSLFRQCRHLSERGDAKISQVGDQFSHCYRVDLFTFALYLRQCALSWRSRPLPLDNRWARTGVLLLFAQVG